MLFFKEQVSFNFKATVTLQLKTVILESKKIKSVTVSTVPPLICHEVMGLQGTSHQNKLQGPGWASRAQGQGRCGRSSAWKGLR